MKPELINYIKIIEGMMFYYEVVETIPFNKMLEDIELSFVSNIVGVKMEKILGKEMWDEYLIATVEV